MERTCCSKTLLICSMLIPEPCRSCWIPSHKNLRSWSRRYAAYSITSKSFLSYLKLLIKNLYFIHGWLVLHNLHSMIWYTYFNKSTLIRSAACTGDQIPYLTKTWSINQSINQSIYQSTQTSQIWQCQFRKCIVLVVIYIADQINKQTFNTSSRYFAKVLICSLLW